MTDRIWVSADYEESGDRLLSMVGERAIILHDPVQKVGGGGGDVDCAVSGIDFLWPLRLEEWKVCQCFHYDIRSWYWVLSRGRDLIALDTSDDPRGLGRYGFPTRFAFERLERPAQQGVRAAYLASKRLRKNDRRQGEWKRIFQMAKTDPESFETCLSEILGRALTKRIIQSDQPGDWWKQARVLQIVRRFRSPTRALMVVLTTVGRLTTRVVRPTGLLVVVAGPDGSGKSTLAEALLDSCGGVFWRYRHLHWRPGVLPRPGALFGRENPDSSRPHEGELHNKVTSIALLFYYWLDFFVGGWLRDARMRARSGLVLQERGWWDFAVDPRRYRLDVPQWLVRLGGLTLPRPDVVFILEGPAEVLEQRKCEVGEDEIRRQSGEWRKLSISRMSQKFKDASASPQALVVESVAEIKDCLERRTIARLGYGWSALPRRGDARWQFPRGPGRTARMSFLLYHPVTLTGRFGWEIGRRLATVGGLRLLPRGHAPPREVRELLAPHVPRGGTFAVARSNHPSRYTALIISPDGPRGMAKVALEANGQTALAKEARALDSIGRHVSGPLKVPRVLQVQRSVLLLEVVEWLPRRRVWQLSQEVAAALGALYRTGVVEEDEGFAHGDCAPWNLLKSKEGWLLVDWEAARSHAPPFFDVFHYLVQAHILLRRPTRPELLRGVRGEDQIGAVLQSYAAGADVELSQVTEYFLSYLIESQRELDPMTEHGRAGLEGRRRLAAGLSG